MNRLARETSPYLQQHRENPVDWFPWGEEAFAEAKRRDVPVFLSIGYSTCHWCHVMAHESFEDPAIARLMNENFVNIKVDREERPDVDRLYMAFVQASTGSGGWPMSVWLTPAARPFFGGTYFPPQDRYGRAGFPNILLQISQVWRDQRERVESEGERVLGALREATVSTRGDVDAVPLARGREAFARSFDQANGGFGGAPKFPRPVVLNFLLRGDERSREMALYTLRKMAAGGLRDHLGGGFHRYSVDEWWHVPHFEKMLYDQAQLVVSYVEAWQLTHEPFFEEIARETLGYVLRDMTHPDGGFYSAEDADSAFADNPSEHGEGAFYVWTQQEILDELGADAGREFSRHYGVEPSGNAAPSSDPQGEFVGKNILIERHGPGSAESRAKLFARRAQRPRPHLDDKVLTGWNALMISAFAKAGAAFNEPLYLAAAEKAVAFLKKNLTRNGGLLRAWRGEVSNIAAFAEDYAFLIQALLDLYEATFDAAHFQWAVELQAKQDALFWGEGSYFGSAAGDPLVPLRMKDDYDGAEPSANAISALNLLRFAWMGHGDAAKARDILAAHAQQLSRVPSAVPQMLVALDFSLSPHAQAVVAGRDGSKEWLKRLHHDFHPRRVLMLSEDFPNLAGMKPVNGRSALYLCENFTCQAPQTL